jgi:hypothetical protein
VGHIWHQYWSWVGGNIGAMPLQAAITVAATLVLRRPISHGWHRLVGEHLDIEDVRRTADSAHKIMADLYEHLTGEQHPEAPKVTVE